MSNKRYAVIRFVEDLTSVHGGELLYRKGQYLAGHILSVNGTDVNFCPLNDQQRRAIGTPWRPWTTMPTSSHTRAWVEASALEQLAMEAE